MATTYSHPDVFVEETSGAPTIVGSSTSTAALVGQAVMGPTDKVGLVTSFQDYARQYGTNYQLNMNLEDSVWGFFANGGQRAFISRITGAGADAATATFSTIGGVPTPGASASANAAPWHLAAGQTLVVAFDGGSNHTYTFTATRAIKAGASGAMNPGASTTLLVNFNGTGIQTVLFAGTEAAAADVVNTINAQIEGGRAVVNGSNVDLQSDVLGTASSVVVTGGTGLTATGITVGSVSGTGNVANVEAVQMAEALTIIGTITDGTAANDGAAHLVFTSKTAGTSSLAQVKNTSTAVAFGFDFTSHAGLAAGAAAPEFSLDSFSVGAWGNAETGTTQRWGVTTAEALVNGGTQVKLTDITKAQVGDVVYLNDGTTTTIVHVRSIDVGNKRIQFQPVTIGSTIASGARAATASSHRAQTTLALAGLMADTIITVTSPSQFKVGSEVTIDDGTHPVLVRVVTKVNGIQVTLNASLGTAISQGAVVALQSFDLVVKVNAANATTYAFLSTQSTDAIDYYAVRLSGDTNESLLVVLSDLAPSISNPLLNRPAPVVDVAFTGGDDGATPGDNDYIGSSSAPKTGLYLFDDVKSINMLGVPGITTQNVQTTLSDYVTLRKDICSLQDPPLADDQPLEVLDFLNNVLNRDTSYSALYYPWLMVRDRYAPSTVTNPQKAVAPCGFLMGVWAQTDTDDNVSVAPLNKPVLGVTGLTHYTSDGEHDLLNPVGVNVIRTFPGEGIKVMGARTLWKTADGRHYINIRRELLFIENSLKTGLRFAVGRPIIDKTFRRVKRVVTSFLRGLWNQGMLFPSNDFPSSQFVKCDTENNPAESRNLGQLIVEVGVNCPPPAEFIVARVGLYDGSSTVDESVQNR